MDGIQSVSTRGTNPKLNDIAGGEACSGWAGAQQSGVNATEWVVVLHVGVVSVSLYQCVKDTEGRSVVVGILCEYIRWGRTMEFYNFLLFFGNDEEKISEMYSSGISTVPRIQGVFNYDKNQAPKKWHR